jgi:Smg protein
MDNTVFDILVYVFDRYMHEEMQDSGTRSSIEEDLHSAGFGHDKVSQALDWLADLADVRQSTELGGHAGTFRVYSADELQRLDADCRGLLLSLERGGVLSAGQREIVIDRLLALESGELGIEHVKWVVLMVLSSQPASETGGALTSNWESELPMMVPH